MVNLFQFAGLVLIALLRSIVFYRCGTFIVNGSRKRVVFGDIYKNFIAGHAPFVFVFTKGGIAPDAICCKMPKTSADHCKAM